MKVRKKAKSKLENAHLRLQVNGEPVEVDTQVTVNFTLSGG